MSECAEHRKMSSPFVAHYTQCALDGSFVLSETPRQMKTAEAQII